MTTEESSENAEEEFLSTQQDEDQAPPATSPIELEQLMHISLQAVQGKTSKSTFTLSVNIGGKKATALVDTGSTHTFIDLKFTTKINCKTTSNTLETVLVAGGGELKTGAHVNELQYTIQATPSKIPSRFSLSKDMT